MTTQVEGDPYPDLLSEKGGRGFPTLKFLDAEGNVLGEPQGRSIESFTATMTAIADCAALEAKAERTPEEDVALFMAQLELGQLSAAEASARFEQLTAMSAEQKAEVQGRLVGMEVEALFSSIRSEEEAMAAMAKCAEMAKAGRTPTGKNMVTMQFWGFTAQWAEENSDADVFEMAYKSFKELIGGDGNPRATAMLEQMEAKLAELKGEGDDGDAEDHEGDDDDAEDQDEDSEDED